MHFMQDVLFLIKCTSIGFHGNAVTAWERIQKEYENTGELLVELGSDQTSCHDPFGGGYYPVQLSYEEAKKVILILMDLACRNSIVYICSLL